MKKMPALLAAAAAYFALALLPGRPGWAAPAGKPSEAASPAVRPSAAAPRDASPAGVSEAGVVNLNDASSEQLQLLPGVGPSRAEAIITYRKTHPFKRVDEVTRIRGIGRKSLLRLRSHLTISGPTTLKERPGKGTSPLARGRQPAAAPTT